MEINNYSINAIIYSTLFLDFRYVSEEIKKERLKDFGLHLAKKRKELGYTQEELAHQSGLTLSQIARIETGVINTTINTVFIIADTLKVPAKNLFEY